MENFAPSPIKVFDNEDEITLTLTRPETIIDMAYLREDRKFTIAAYNEQSGEPQSLDQAHLDLSSEEQHALAALMISLPQ